MLQWSVEVLEEEGARHSSISPTTSKGTQSSNCYGNSP